MLYQLSYASVDNDAFCGIVVRQLSYPMKVGDQDLPGVRDKPKKVSTTELRVQPEQPLSADLRKDTTCRCRQTRYSHLPVWTGVWDSAERTHGSGCYHAAPRMILQKFAILGYLPKPVIRDRAAGLHK